MNKKEKALGLIARIIAQNGITLDEVADSVNYLPPLERFDVAVITEDDLELRVPFFKRSNMEVIGIYPFKDCAYYLQLKEDTKMTRAQAYRRAKDNEAIPPIWFWKRVEKILSHLNEALKQLHASTISGHYYAAITGDDFKRKENMIAEIINGKVEVSLFSADTLAYTRYVGYIGSL